MLLQMTDLSSDGSAPAPDTAMVKVEEESVAQGLEVLSRFSNAVFPQNTITF